MRALSTARSLAEKAGPACPRTYSHGIDVRFVANEGLSAHRIPYIP